MLLKKKKANRQRRKPQVSFSFLNILWSLSIGSTFYYQLDMYDIYTLDLNEEENRAIYAGHNYIRWGLMSHG